MLKTLIQSQIRSFSLESQDNSVSVDMVSSDFPYYLRGHFAIDKEIELPDTQNRIFNTKELEQSDAPKKKGSSYIVKEEGNQIRKKTNPGE